MASCRLQITADQSVVHYASIRSRTENHHTSAPTYAGPVDGAVTKRMLLKVKAKGSTYSITERRVPALIPVLGSQPAGDVSHKPDSRLPLLSAMPLNIRGRLPVSLLSEQRRDGC